MLAWVMSPFSMVILFAAIEQPLELTPVVVTVFMWMFQPQPLTEMSVATMLFIGTKSEVIALPVIDSEPMVTLSKVPGCTRVIAVSPAVTTSKTALSADGPLPVLAVPPGVMVMVAEPKSTVVIMIASIASIETDA